MIDHLDHLVLTTSHEAACIDFYTRVLFRAGALVKTSLGYFILLSKLTRMGRKKSAPCGPM